ncbi:MAG: DUF2271 domain-containing protein [Pseudomonadota bacterium]
MRKTLIVPAAAIALASVPASADTGTATFEIPRIEASNYRKPYVSIWLEDADRKTVKMYRVLFDQSPIGDRWLPDLKTWWRRGGRAMEMPVAGVTRPTRGPGSYKLKMGSLAQLPAGQYALVFEAAREKGGREVVKLPFEWAPGQTVSVSAAGSTEMGAVSLTISGE